MNRRLFSFTGASGTGKSTLLRELDKQNGIKTIELSARPYLPKEGDYVQNSSELVQSRITYGSTVSMLENVLMYPDKKLFFSRCAIDKLAYVRTFGLCKDFEDILKREIIRIVGFHLTVFYLPIEFNLDNNDEIRGNNEEVRKETDKNIKIILDDFFIPYIEVKGMVSQRLNIIYPYL